MCRCRFRTRVSLEGCVERNSGGRCCPSLILTNDMQKLHQFTLQNTADLSGRIVYNQEGQEVFNFGKYKNVPVEEVLAREPGYYDWMMRGDFPLYTKKVLTRIKLRSVQAKLG